MALSIVRRIGSDTSVGRSCPALVVRPQPRADDARRGCRRLVGCSGQLALVALSVAVSIAVSLLVTAVFKLAPQISTRDEEFEDVVEEADS